MNKHFQAKYILVDEENELFRYYDHNPSKYEIETAFIHLIESGEYDKDNTDFRVFEVKEI